MFTPPPSPRPIQFKEAHPFEKYQLDHDDMKPKSPSSSDETKRNSGRRIRWAVLAVPFIVILLTASTRFFTNYVAVDLLSEPSSTSWLSPIIKRRRRLHKRSPEPQTAALSSTSAIAFPTSPSASTSSSSSTATATSQSLPTIPTSPPVLPTPFPQPFDTSLGNNFSTVGCQNFFINMTTTVAFRECRPFSLLLLSSSAFIQQAQQNITALNAIIWGTCNTDPGKEQCTANMSWFVSALQSACQKDLSDLNANAVNTLQALQAYSLMLATGCIADPTTNSYCYVSAAVNSNPSDLYFYQLPLGTNLSNKTTISCSACTKSLMGLYDSALTGSAASSLTGLQKTYNNAATFGLATVRWDLCRLDSHLTTVCTTSPISDCSHGERSEPHRGRRVVEDGVHIFLARSVSVSTAQTQEQVPGTHEEGVADDPARRAAPRVYFVLLLPHGLDGPGPKHSSSHLEPMLQLSNDRYSPHESEPNINMDVVSRSILPPPPTATRPKLLETACSSGPQGILRLAAASSPLVDFECDRAFQPILADPIAVAAAAERVVHLSGKIYYELAKERQARTLDAHVTLVHTRLLEYPCNVNSC